MTPQDFIEKYGITGRITAGPDYTTDGDEWEHYAMTVNLTQTTPTGGRIGIMVPWRMGLGLDVGAFTGDGDDLPTESVGEVLESLSGELPVRHMPYPEFADDFDAWDEEGYGAWEACRELARKVHDWCHSQAMVEDLESVEAE